MSLSKTAKYYRNHPESRKKHVEYQKEYNKKPEQVEKRKALNKWNRDTGNYGDHDNKDAAHKGNKIVGEKNASKNRGSKSDAPGDKRARGKK